MNHRDATEETAVTVVGMRLLMLASIVFGGGSLLLFAGFLWVGSFLLVPLGLGPIEVLVWNAALSVLFFAQHSVMIRRGFRRRADRLIPRHLYRAGYSIASGVSLLMVLVLWQGSSVEIWSMDPPWRWVLRAVFCASALGFVAGTRVLHGLDGLGLRPIRDRIRNRVRQPSPLTVEGVYRWVRHPLYTCVLLMIWSCPDVTADRLVFNLLWSTWIVAGVILEERDLSRDFGDAYSRYQRAVPMLIPWRGRQRSAALPDRRAERDTR